jgi:hypothetical protein
MPDKSKFERELDEILEKSEDSSAPQSRRRRPAGKHRTYDPFSHNVTKSEPPKRSLGIKLNSGNLILGGLVAIAIAAFIPKAQLPVAILGVILLLIGYLLWFRKRSSSSGIFVSASGMFGRGKSSEIPDKAEPEVKYWRGRRVDDKSEPQDQGKIIEFPPPDNNNKS